MIQRLKQACWLGPWMLLFVTLSLAHLLLTGSGFHLWLSLHLYLGVALLIAWLAYHAVRIYPTGVGLMGYALFIGLLSGLLFFALDYYWIQYNIPVPVATVYRLPLWLLFTCWTSLSCALVRKNRTLTSELQQQQSAASLHREAALFKLRQQFQPHFLYNSLNSINALIAVSPQEAQKMVVKLSDFLRTAVRQEGAERIPLSEELTYIQNYLDIELIRFGHRLKIDWQINAPETTTLPPLLLQPLLENAIKYGLYGVSEEVTIQLSLDTEDGMLVCRISNPCPAEQQTGPGTGFGLYGLQQRLQLLFARADLLSITQTDKQFTATLKIPQNVAPAASGQPFPTAP